MNTRYDFILTNNTKLVNKNKNLFFLKKTYNFDINNEFLKENDANIYNPPSYTREQIIQEYEFCEQIFKLVFNDLAIALNSLNDVKYSLRAWEIILGVWLRNFIRFAYKNFKNLKYILENNNINKIYAIDPNKYDLFTEDTYSFYMASRLDDEWLYSLNAKILKHLNVNHEIICSGPKNSYFQYQDNKHLNFNYLRNSFKFSYKHKLIRQISKLLFFLRSKNDALIYDSHLSFLNEKKLEIALGQFPRYFEQIKIRFKKFDKKLRFKINLNSDDKLSNFENFIRHILPSSLPVAVIESFWDINKLSATSYYPKKPKFIFTSTGFESDEVFKFYVAKKVEEGVPYYVGQHGSNYFTSVHTKHLTELKTCDKFISWGGKYQSNDVPTFNFRTLGKKKLFNKDGYLLIICDRIDVEPLMEIYVSEKDQEKTVQSISFLITKLNNNIKKKTKIRLNDSFYNSNRGLYYKKYYQDTGVEIDSGETNNIEKLLIDTKVSLFLFDSTGILENLSLNMPTICFFNNDLRHINKRNIEDYNLLINANILFTDKNKLIAHLTKYWSDIDKWWLDEKTQLNINQFNNRLNKSGDINSIRNLANILGNQGKKNEK